MDEGGVTTNRSYLKEPEAPWEYRPLQGVLRMLAYPVIVVAMLGFMQTIGFAAIVGLLVIPSSESVTEVLVHVLLWLLIISAGIFFLWLFVKLNRRLDLPRYMKKCPDGGVYFIRRPILKSFTKTGYVSFADDGMELEGTLSPNLLWPILAFGALIAFFILLMFTGGPVIFLGGLDGLLLLLVYGFIFKRETRLTVSPEQVRSVRCKGPLIKILLEKETQLPIGSVTVLLPPKGRVEFLKKLDVTFPGKLPDNYRAALEKV